MAVARLRERFAKFSLDLHPDKTLLIEFGPHAARQRAARGEGKPETFSFLGFTHICATTRSGRFWIRRQTGTTRLRAKLKQAKAEIRVGHPCTAPCGLEHQLLLRVAYRR